MKFEFLGMAFGGRFLTVYDFRLSWRRISTTVLFSPIAVIRIQFEGVPSN
jgi:hypothetical protein